MSGLSAPRDESRCCCVSLAQSWRIAICRDYGTDKEAISVTIFGTRTKHVYFDTGCSSRADPSITQALQAFRNLADSIDSLTGAKRWIHPRVLR